MRLALPSSRTPSSCRVWVGSRPCVFGSSVFDGLIAAEQQNGRNNIFSSLPTPTSTSTTPEESLSSRHRKCRHYDRTLTTLKRDGDCVRFVPCGSGGRNGHGGELLLPFGRTRNCPELGSTRCPTTVDETRIATAAAAGTCSAAAADVPNRGNEAGGGAATRRRRPFAELAVVGMVLDPTEQGVLVTRRPAHMRSFPGAWVFPGGSVDRGEDSSLEGAVSREVFEETGLSIPVDDWKARCIWESVYPTIPQKGVPIKRHHVVIYLSAVLRQKTQPLNLCEEEVDAAAWLSRKHAQDIVNTVSLSSSIDIPSRAGDQQQRAGGRSAEDKLEQDRIPLLQLITDTTPNRQHGVNQETISLKELSGIYPQQRNEKNYGTYGGGVGIWGMAQGSLFAMEEFLHSWGRRRSMI